MHNVRPYVYSRPCVYIYRNHHKPSSSRLRRQEEWVFLRSRCRREKGGYFTGFAREGLWKRRKRRRENNWSGIADALNYSTQRVLYTESRHTTSESFINRLKTQFGGSKYMDFYNLAILLNCDSLRYG